MSDEEPKDPILEATLDRALAPYTGILSPERLAEFRETMRAELARHPVSSRLLRQIRPAPSVLASAEVERSDGVAGPKGSQRKVDAGGKR